MYRSLIFIFFLLNCRKTYRERYMMDQENDPNAHQEMQNSNDQERDLLNEINEGLKSLRDLSRQLRVTRQPTCLSLASSLDTMISLIQETQSQLTNITDYRTRMREFYSTRLSKEGVKDLNISKQELLLKFLNPRDNTMPPVTKRRICMDWCIYQPWRDHWMDHWFMVFDKAPNNNMEVPLYFLRKLWAEFVLGLHVNYFDITEFQGASFGSA